MAKMLKRFIRDRKGTAEVIGSVMFIIIIIFFFSNVYLWHDQATKQMNTVLSDKMNSPISITVFSNGIGISNNGGVETKLSRFWVNSSSVHYFADLEGLSSNGIILKSGQTTNISIVILPNAPIHASWDGTKAIVQFNETEPVTIKIVTTNGNTASCTYPSSGNPSQGPQGPPGPQGPQGPEANLTEVIGDFIPDYHSFQWAVFNAVLLNQSTWTSGWNINVPTNDFVCFKINLTYYGSGSITLSQNTMINVIDIVKSPGNSDKYYFFTSYIGDCTRTGSVLTLAAYNSQKVQFSPGQTLTIYFYAKVSSGTTGQTYSPDNKNVNANLWLNLLLYSTASYGQSFPLVTVTYNGP